MAPHARRRAHTPLGMLLALTGGRRAVRKRRPPPSLLRSASNDMQDTALKQRLASRLAHDLGRRDFLRGSAAIGGAAALGALPDTTLAAEPKRGGTIKWAHIVAPDTLDPHFTGSLGAIKIHNNIYNGLLKVTYEGGKVSFVPDLAEKWTMVDEKTHVFTLRPGVKFHNGDACDAAAVKWSIERVKDPAVASPHSWMVADLAGIDIVDPLTVRVRYAKPFAFFTVAMTGATGRAGTIVSRSAVEKFGKDFGRNPVGTGPFRFVSWKENEMIELARNPDYFEKGLPYLDKIQIMLVKEPTSAVAAVLSGQVDGMDACPFQFMSQLRANKNLNIYGDVEGNYAFLGMNNKRGPFADDVNLRLAVAFAIDRATIVKQGYFGDAIAAYTPISPPMTGFYDPAIAKSGRGQFFDLKRAQAYRAKAKTQGEIEVTYIATEAFTSNGGSGSRNAQLIIPMLAKIGIKVKLELMDRAILTKRRNSGEFDLYDEAWQADLDPDETIRPEWVTGKPWNYVGYSNPEFDKLINEASETVDRDKRKKLYYAAEDIMMQKDAPIAILAHTKVYKIFNKKVEGFKYVPVDLMNMHTVSLK
jgi:peptide/nickel transport system substrate-binding protein